MPTPCDPQRFTTAFQLLNNRAREKNLMRTTLARPVIALFLLAPVLGLPQPPQTKAAALTVLTVKGYSGQAPVIQANGKSWVEVESLARLTNSTLSFQANQITLSLPASGAVPASTQTDRLSKEFLRAVIEEMSAIGAWRTGLANAIQSGSPITQDWADSFRRTADNRLALASTTVTTEPDRNLLLLLRSEFSNMRVLSDRYVAMHNTQTFVSPDSLDSDPLNQQIQNCAHGVASLTASGQFVDVASCH